MSPVRSTKDKRKKRKTSNGVRGTILLVTLWILVILSLLAIGIGFRTSIELRLAGYQVDSLKAYEIAKAGIVKAIQELGKDDTETIDIISQCGISLKPDETQEGKFHNIKIGEGHFDISYVDDAGRTIFGIEDIYSKIDINTAPKAVLMASSPDISSEVADNVIAWRGDAAVNLPVTPVASDYAPKGARFDAPNELLLVRDITPEIFNGHDGQKGIKDFVTVYGPKEGLKININTASQKVFEVILESMGVDKGRAVEIVNYRAGGDGNDMTPGDNNPYTGKADEYLKAALKDDGLLVGPFTSSLALNKIEFVSGSSYFRIRSTGTLEGRRYNIHKTITCVVNRKSLNEINIISWTED